MYDELSRVSPVVWQAHTRPLFTFHEAGLKRWLILIVDKHKERLIFERQVSEFPSADIFWNAISDAIFCVTVYQPASAIPAMIEFQSESYFELLGKSIMSLGIGARWTHKLRVWEKQFDARRIEIRIQSLHDHPFSPN